MQTFTVTVKYIDEPVISFPGRTTSQMRSIMTLIETETLEHINVIREA